MGKLILAVSVALLWTTNLFAQTPYYQGKTIRLIVGSSAGSTYDGYMRLIAQYWGKHIPGNPAIVGQNMPGAGSQIAANFVYNAAKPDGLTLASVIPALYFNQLAGKKEVQFDWSKFTFIGSPDRSVNLLYVRADTPFKTIHDLRTASTPPKCSATGTGTVGHYFPRLLEETIGAKVSIVTARDPPAGRLPARHVRLLPFLNPSLAPRIDSTGGWLRSDPRSKMPAPARRCRPHGHHHIAPRKGPGVAS